MVEIRKPIPVGEAVSKVMEYETFGNGELVSINESSWTLLIPRISCDE